MDLGFILLTKGLIAGFCYSLVSVTAALYCAHFVIKRSWFCGWVAGVGIAIIQMVWAGFALWALEMTIDYFTFNPITVAVIGAMILYLLAYRSYQASKEPLHTPRITPHQKLKAFAQALVLGLAYPLRIVGFAAIFVMLGVHELGAFSMWEGFGAIIGVGLGALCWWTLVTLAVLGLRKRIPPNYIALLRRLTAFGIAAFATGGLIIILLRNLLG